MIEIAGVAFEVVFDVCEEFLDFNGVGGELEFVAVAEDEAEGGFFAGGMGHGVVEAAPVAGDLIEGVFLVVVLAGAIQVIRQSFAG